MRAAASAATRETTEATVVTLRLRRAIALDAAREATTAVVSVRCPLRATAALVVTLTGADVVSRLRPRRTKAEAAVSVTGEVVVVSGLLVVVPRAGSEAVREIGELVVMTLRLRRARLTPEVAEATAAVVSVR